ncbi:hypothetical protein [Micromonospora sp. NPDC005979]|uniref:hypothetical protein n=1 Tax=Micromonospora sp. NPDC005979 TaxID=3156726 RepID=UPI0033B309FE
MTPWEGLRGAAPPTLLRERPLADAEEVLVLTYTCDLSFFEDVCLREAQAVRARTTILYDADRVTQGPRRADYLALPVVCKGGGAFHPKLVVIASETDAVVAIGSGNATPSGWHHNAEVWTLLRGEGQTVPQLFHDLAAWLRRLPAAVWVENLGRERLDRVAALLTARPAEQASGQPVLVTTAVRPIVEQLPVPKTPVVSLAVAAPFFDAPAEALSRLLDRFGPDELHLLVTRDVQCDPDALARVVKRSPTSVVATPKSSRYHHAKIVEWRTGDQSWALTGSANCSVAALVKTMATGGNCELGLLTETAPLIDTGTADEVDLAQPAILHVREPGARAPSEATLRVLGVRVDAERVEATVLVDAELAPGWLMVDGLRLDHDHSDGKLHRYIGVPAADWSLLSGGRATVSVETDLGVEVRDVVVTDVTAALSRIDRPSPLEHTSLPLVIADQAHLAALLEALAQLAAVRPDGIATPSGVDRRRQVEGRITAAVGPALLRFTLGVDDRNRPTSVDEEIFDDLEKDNGASPVGSGQEKRGRTAERPPARAETVATVLDALTPNQRKRRQREVEELVHASERWSLPAKLAVSRLVLTLVAGGLWQDPTDWSDRLYWVVLQLWMTDQEESLNDEHAALATIGLVALRSGLDRRPEPDSELVEQFEDLRQAYVEWADWLAAVPVETVRRYASGLGGHTFGLLFGQTDFVAELGWILGRSALHDAVDRLTGAQLDSGSVVRVTGGRTTRQAVIAALDGLRDFPDVQVASEGEPTVHGWWNGRRLLLVTRTGATWRAETWSNLMTGIAAYSRGTPLRPPDRRWTASGPDDAFGSQAAGP